MDETDLTKIIKGKNPKKPDSGIPVEGKLMSFAAPVFGSYPSLGTFFGLGATGAIYLGSPENTNISNMIAVAQITTKNQFIAAIKGTLMTSENKWEMLSILNIQSFRKVLMALEAIIINPLRKAGILAGFKTRDYPVLNH
jgi:hypothetical protein